MNIQVVLISDSKPGIRGPRAPGGLSPGDCTSQKNVLYKIGFFFLNRFSKREMDLTEQLYFENIKNIVI